MTNGPDLGGPKTCGSCWPESPTLGKFPKRPGVNPIVRRRNRLPLIEKKVPRLLADVILVARASHIVVAAPRHPPPLLEQCAAAGSRYHCRLALQQNKRPRAPTQQQGLPAAAQHFFLLTLIWREQNVEREVFKRMKREMSLDKLDVEQGFWIDPAPSCVSANFVLEFKALGQLTSKHCWGSVTFWCGSGYADLYLWLMDPDPTPDPTPFFSDFNAKKNYFFHIFFL